MTELQKSLEESGLDILPDNKGWTNRFHIKSESSNRLYVIAQRQGESTFACSCPGWITRRKCKYLNAIMPLIEQAQRSIKKLK